MTMRTRPDSPEDPDARLRGHRARFDELLDRTELDLARGRYADAARLAQVAAALAWHSPTGLFVSPRLEATLDRIGRATMPPTGTQPARSSRPQIGGRQRILHVLTTAYGVGGHTRLVWRWIKRDDERRHVVALTRQLAEPVPRALVREVVQRGGAIERLDLGRGDLIERAAALQAMSASADVVVLHIHPFDVVPSIAAAGLLRDGARPPILLVNHADHVFWVGLEASDMVVHLRASGQRLAAGRRGLPDVRSAILPIPLDPAPSSIDRATARRCLGIAADEVLALSVASGYKFGSSSRDGLLPVLEEAVARWPKLRVVAVGPADRPWWKAAARQTGGRIQAFANVTDVGPLYAAADVYLDSAPFSSLTSMLEAGQRGVPLLAFNDSGDEGSVLSFDDPATTGLGIGHSDPHSFLAALDALLASPEVRADRGREIQTALATEHEGDGWRRHLEDIYRLAKDLHGMPEGSQPPHSLAIGDDHVDALDRRLIELLDAQQSDAPRGVRGHLRFAPFRIRLEELRRSRGSARPLSPLVLIPERVLIAVRQAGILATRRWRALRSSFGALRH